MPSFPNNSFAFAAVLAVCLVSMMNEAFASPQLGGVSQSDGDAGQSETISSSSQEKQSHGSLTSGFLETMGRPIGFSMGFFELYAPGQAAESVVDRNAVYTLVRPRIFARTRTKRSQFQVEYSFGYRQYNRHPEVRSSEHTAILDYSYQLSRNTTLHISDDFRSQFNDRGVLPTSSAPVLYQPSFAQGLYVPGERSTTNSLLTGISYRFGRRSTVTTFTSYDLWRYGTTTFGDSHGIQAGIRGDLQISKWFFLDSGYSHYLNLVPGKLQSTNIHRLQAGGLKFRPRRTVELYVSGGVDSTRLQDRQHTIGSYEGGISKVSGSTLLSLVYHRGFSVAIGPQSTLNGHVVSATLSQWLSRRISIQATSSYMRGFSLNKESKLSYLGANAELPIVLQRHVLYSAQYSYISQHGTALTSNQLLLNRYTITTGLQFMVPSLSGREQGTR